MNEEIFTTVLNDILEEMQKTTQSVRELQAAVVTLQAKADHFGQQLTELRIVMPPPDIKPVIEEIDRSLKYLSEYNRTNIIRLSNDYGKYIQTLSGEQEQRLTQIIRAIEIQPKPLVRQFRIAFFPEPDSQGYYKFMVNRLLLWAACFCAMIILYFLASRFIARAYPDHPPSATSPVQHDLPSQHPDTAEPVHIPSSGQANPPDLPQHHSSRRSVGKKNKINFDTLNKINIHVVTDSIP